MRESGLELTPKTREQLEEELQRGLQSGPGVEMTAEEWQRLRDEVAQRAATQRAS